MDQAACNDPTQILQRGAVGFANQLDRRDQQQSGMLQNTFDDGKNHDVTGKNSVGYRKSQHTANKAKKVKHLPATAAIGERKNGQ